MNKLHKFFVLAGVFLMGFGILMALIVFSPVGAVLAAEPGDSGIAWGPSYYNDTPTISPESSRNELDFMREVDRQALLGTRLSPSYVGENAVPTAAPHNMSGITWGPSYYGDDTTVEIEKNRAELLFQQMVSPLTLNGVNISPRYHK